MVRRVAMGVGGAIRTRFRAPESARPLVIAAAALFLACAAAGAQEVTVSASADPAEVRENEPFTYTIRAEGRVRGEPDIAPLEREVDILHQASSTRVQIVNDEALPITEWLFQVMPRGPGTLTLPPVEVAGVSTNAIEVQVRPAEAADGPEDLFLEVAVEPPEPYVQSQVIYHLRIFVGVNTGRGTVTPPEVTDGDAIIEAVDQQQYQTVHAGRAYTVYERRFAVFPQRVGRLMLGPSLFEAMVIPDRGFSRMERLRSEPVELEVRPAVPPPGIWSNAAWLPATRVSISEGWSENAEETLVAGVPVTRTIVVEAEGLQETQLPPLSVAQNEAIRHYPDRPELARDTGTGGLVARRTERFAVLGLRAGEAVLPAVELPWWNVAERRWEVARLPERSFTIVPGAVPRAPPLPPVESAASAPSGARALWPAVSAVLLMAWLATLALWWRDRRAVPVRRPRTEKPVGRRAANKRLLRQLRLACDRSDDEVARRLLLEWGKLRFPEVPPRTLGALARRLPEPLAREVNVLEAHAYGARRAAWDGSGLRAALTDVDSVARTGARRGADPLLPLYR